MESIPTAAWCSKTRRNRSSLTNSSRFLIGDCARHGVTAAKAAGMTAIAVPGLGVPHDRFEHAVGTILTAFASDS
jgi:beta-phosphoglucomutase-like phosphatase (HAD superfamily)